MKSCFELLKNVLMDAFNVSAIYFTPPYKDISKIDQGIRAAVWTDYNDDHTKIRFTDMEQKNRLLIIRSNLGFYNVMAFWVGGKQADFIAIGPFRNDELSPSYFTQILKDAHITPDTIQRMKYIYESMPFAQVDAVVNVTRHILGNSIPAFQDLEPELIEYAKEHRPIEVHTEIMEENFLNFSEHYVHMLSSFLKSLKSGDNTQAKKALQLFLHESKLTTTRTMRHYKSLLAALNNYCHMALLGTSIHPTYILKLAASIGNRIESTTSLAKLEQMPNDICHKYCLLVKNYANPECSKLTRDIIAYVQMHLAEELSLNQLAASFDKNPSFLSKTFSTETGQALTNFIQQTRIQEAIRLFNTADMPVSEVSLAVGYQDFSYFSKVFSKIVGISPREYKHNSRLT